MRPSGHFAKYIALGDSISTDDYPGESRGAASLFFKNQDRIYPDFHGKDLRSLYPGISFLCLAEDGATTSDVLQSQLQNLPGSDSTPTILTLTAGGNDILSGEATPEEILFRIHSVVCQLQSQFPNGRILLGTIYDPTDGEGDLLEPGVRLTREMEFLEKTNKGIRKLSDPPQICVIDIHKHFLGHGFHCTDPQNRYYYAKDTSLWYVMNIEPNQRGAHEIRRLFWKEWNRQRVDRF